MRRCAHFSDGAFQRCRDVSRHGFTLLELCMVLFIIALLAGAMMPAMESAFTEQAVRVDAHQLSLMVKTAMIQSTDQHRAYVIDFTSNTMSLHPAGSPAKDKDMDFDSSSSTENTEQDSSSVPEDVEITQQINKSNKLQFPDPEKPNAWATVESASWLFRPGDLCQVPRVRLSRGKSWVELSFNPLTGNVENETAYFP